MADDTDYQSVLDMYAQSGMRNPQISYDANGKPIVVAGDAGLPVDVSTLQDYAATLPPQQPNPLPTHQPWVNPIAKGGGIDALTGLGGGERYQLFPERIVRSALSLPTDVMSGKVATPMQQPAGGSEEDYSSDPLLQRVQDMAALMGGGGVASAEEGALGTAGAKLIQPAAEEIAPVFHSAVENAVNTSTLKSANPDQWLGTIKNAKGVKPEELDWTGLKDWLGEQSGPVSKEQVQGYLQQNKVGLGEVNKNTDVGRPLIAKRVNNYWEIRGDDGQFVTNVTEPITETEALTEARNRLGRNQPTELGSLPKYEKYQLPGGENYREKLLTLPNNQFRTYEYEWFDPKTQTSKQFKTEAEAKASAPEGAIVVPKETGEYNTAYKSSHWDEPNILAHIRMNDRNVEGKNALHIEEIQSDWHQQGREQGYKITESQKAELNKIENKLTTGLSEGDIGNPDMDAVLKTATEKKVITPQEAKNYKEWSKGENSTIPDAPFKKTWLDLALKRVIREAAESGKDRISWTPGEAQAARYDLSKSINEINYDPTIGKLVAVDKGNARVLDENNVKPEKLPDYIGKEAAKNLLESEKTTNGFIGSGSFHVLKGQDLKVGGEGMHYFYDKMLPSALERLTEQKMKVGSVNPDYDVVPGYKGKFDVVYKDGKKVQSFETKEAAQQFVNDRGKKINYIDLPQSVKDVALHKGFPLFSSGLMLNPVQGDPFKKSKFKLVPVTSEPKFK